MADAHEAVGQDMKQEAADELFSRQGHRLQCVAGFAIAVGEGDLGIFDRRQTMVRDGHPMGIATQVVEDFLGSREGLFGIDVPVLFANRLN